ncbi:hypothetical protein UNPF46_35175 [Bradyrhizobium sp. UNPF46]|nr:hypothetical protein UNPF46_35175 [Bradyrhizobium sp. UNPF46]
MRGLVPRTQRSAPLAMRSIVQRAVRCRAGAHAGPWGVAFWVPALRRTADAHKQSQQADISVALRRWRDYKARKRNEG